MPGREDNTYRAVKRAVGPREVPGAGQEHGIPQQQPEVAEGAGTATATHPGDVADEEVEAIFTTGPERGSGYGSTQEEGQSAANDHPAHGADHDFGDT